MDSIRRTILATGAAATAMAAAARAQPAMLQLQVSHTNTEREIDAAFANFVQQRDVRIHVEFRRVTGPTRT